MGFASFQTGVPRMLFGLSASGTLIPLSMMVRHTPAGFGAMVMPISTDEGFIMLQGQTKLSITAVCGRTAKLLQLQPMDALTGDVSIRSFMPALADLIAGGNVVDASMHQSQDAGASKQRGPAARTKSVWAKTTLLRAGPSNERDTSDTEGDHGAATDSSDISVKITSFTLPTTRRLSSAIAAAAAPVGQRSRGRWFSQLARTDSRLSMGEELSEADSTQTCYVVHWRPYIAPSLSRRFSRVSSAKEWFYAAPSAAPSATGGCRMSMSGHSPLVETIPQPTPPPPAGTCDSRSPKSGSTDQGDCTKLPRRRRVSFEMLDAGVARTGTNGSGPHVSGDSTPINTEDDAEGTLMSASSTQLQSQVEPLQPDLDEDDDMFTRLPPNVLLTERSSKVTPSPQRATTVKPAAATEVAVSSEAAYVDDDDASLYSANQGAMSDDDALWPRGLGPRVASAVVLRRDSRVSAISGDTSSVGSYKSATTKLRTFIEGHRIKMDPGLLQLRRAFLRISLLTLAILLAVTIITTFVRRHDLEMIERVYRSSLRQKYAQSVVEDVQFLHHMQQGLVDPLTGGRFGVDPGPNGTTLWLTSSTGRLMPFENATRAHLLQSIRRFETVHKQLYTAVSESGGAVADQYNKPHIAVTETQLGKELIHEKSLLELGNQFVQQARIVAFLPLSDVSTNTSAVSFVMANGGGSLRTALDVSTELHHASSVKSFEGSEDTHGIALMTVMVLIDVILIGVIVPIVRRVEESKEAILTVFLEVPRLVVRYLQKMTSRRLDEVTATDQDDADGRNPEELLDEFESLDWSTLKIQGRRKARAYTKSIRYESPQFNGACAFRFWRLSLTSFVMCCADRTFCCC